MRNGRTRWLWGCLAILTVLSAVWLAPSGLAQGPATPREAGRDHGEHRTPEGWRFTWPKGDPAKGREAFVKLECYSCHEVRGESFPAPSDRDKVGPELSAMGPLHDLEYFAEAIINPNAVLEPGKGYQAVDGSSKMPSYSEAMTVQEAIDLAAYLKALRPPSPGAAGSGGGASGGHDAHH